MSLLSIGTYNTIIYLFLKGYFLVKNTDCIKSINKSLVSNSLISFNIFTDESNFK